MRLFVAIDLTDDARRELAAEQDRLARLWTAPHRPKFARPDQLHLTLVFIGQVADDRVQAFAEAVGRALDQPPFELDIAGLGVFPPHGAPRILWAAVEQGAPEVIRVQDMVATRLEPLGVAREPRPYFPHLTLARWRNSRPADAAPAKTAPRRLLARVPVASVTLYQSKLSPLGSTYTAIARAELT